MAGLRLTIIATISYLAGCATESIVPPSGSMTFATHCSSCHGRRGEGDGPVAQVMTIDVPNLRALSQRNGGEFPATAVASYIDGRNLPASHGDRTMPIWGDVFDATTRVVSGAESAQARIDSVVEYLREIQYR
jgi:mono/diheme cytochrome c family protein